MQITTKTLDISVFFCYTIYMRVFAISDLHLDKTNSKPMNIFGPVWTNQMEEILESAKKMQIKSDDVVLIAGDISWAMKLEGAREDLEFLSQIPGKKIILRGNHDYWWSSLTKVKAALPSDVFPIQNDAIKFGEYIFCGTRGWDHNEGKNYTKEDEAIFNREVLRLELSIKEAKKLQTNNEKIICLMHFPPFNFKRENSQFTSLIEDAGIKKVIYGHIHSNFKGRDALINKNGVEYYFTSCDFLKNNIVQID